MRNASGNFRRGILLLEMMVVLALMAVSALLIGDLLNMSIRAKLQAERRDTMIGRVDLAMDLLRRDTWGAREIRAAGDSLELADAEGTVNWRMKDGGVLERRAGDGVRTFVGMPAFGFSAKGAVLKAGVDSGAKENRIHEEAVLVSERMLGGGS